MKDFFARLSWADYIAAAFLVRGLYVGYRSGIFAEFLRSVSHVASVMLAMLYGGVAAQYLTLNTFMNEATAHVIGFIAVFLAAFLATFAARKLLLKIFKIGEGGGPQRVLGALLGGARWIILLSLVFMAVGRSPLKQLKTDVQERSLTGGAISQVAPLLLAYMGQAVPELAAPAPAK